jgi:hypothetical protein
MGRQKFTIYLPSYFLNKIEIELGCSIGLRAPHPRPAPFTIALHRNNK